MHLFDLSMILPQAWGRLASNFAVELGGPLALAADRSARLFDKLPTAAPRMYAKKRL